MPAGAALILGVMEEALKQLYYVMGVDSTVGLMPVKGGSYFS